jgi:hypothetical protein
VKKWGSGICMKKKAGLPAILIQPLLRGAFDWLLQCFDLKFSDSEPNSVHVQLHP